MNLRKRYPLMNEAGDGSSTGAPAPAPAPAPTEGGGESLLNKPGGNAPAPAPASGDADPYAWLDTKFQVKGADGKLDLEASSKKLNESYGHLAKRLGAGDVPPATAADYKFTPTEALKDVKLDDALSGKFREQAHKLGLSQAQYQGVIESHLQMVPEVLNAALQLQKDEARAQLQQVWQSTAEYEKQMSNAQRAVDAVTGPLGEDLWTRFGRDPAFIQFAARMGSEMREDKPNVERGGSQDGGQKVEALMASPAYRDPKHPDHARVSAEVRDHHARLHGDKPAM